MKKLDKFLFHSKTNAEIAFDAMCEKLRKKTNGGEELITKIMLMVVAVVLVVVFMTVLGGKKDGADQGLIGELLAKVSENILKIFDSVSP